MFFSMRDEGGRFQIHEIGVDGEDGGYSSGEMSRIEGGW